MPRVIVDSALADTLRSLRIEKKKKSKELANVIQKSPAYITKLEKGDIKSIEMDELSSILKFITGEQSSIALTDQIYKSLKLKYSAKEIEKQLWYINYETVECQLPITDGLIDAINNHINRLNITRHYLLYRINSNEALTEEEKNDKSLPYNQWYHNNVPNKNYHGIKIKLSEETLNKLLDKKIDLVPYVFLFSIVFYIFKIRSYHELTVLEDDQYYKLFEETEKFLSNHKFITVSEKHRLLSEKQSKEEMLELLNSFDKDNIDIINDIIQGFSFASEQNIKLTNERLSSFAQNMHWDLGFMLKLISLNYRVLNKTSVSNKHNLLSEIENIIVKYENYSDADNRLELY